jgi:hypothetical protein
MSAARSSSTTSLMPSASKSIRPGSGVNEGLHQLPQERVGDRDHVRHVFRHHRVTGARDPRGEEAVGDRLRVHVGEVVVGQVVDQRFLKGLHQLAQRAAFGFYFERGIDAAADGAGEVCQCDRQLPGRANGFQVPQREGFAPAVAPDDGVNVRVRPAQFGRKLMLDEGEFEVAVVAVPAEHLEGRQVAPLGAFREVSEGDLPLFPLTVGGDEQQVVQVPRRALRCGAGGALLDDELAEDAAQRDDR